MKPSTRRTPDLDTICTVTLALLSVTVWMLVVAFRPELIAMIRS